MRFLSDVRLAAIDVAAALVGFLLLTIFGLGLVGIVGIPYFLIFSPL